MNVRVLSSRTKFNQGFTIIELVVVILLLGILSATVVPRFFSSSGFEEYAYRTEVIATLRTVQLRAMQQTGGSLCHQIKITDDGKQLGLLDNDDSPGPCHAGNWFDSKRYNLSIEDGPTHVRVDGGHDITFSGDDFSFDQMGRPSNCSSPCEISINGGEQPLKVMIEPEGYIHAG
ncbi:MSHA biogenesis protein MshC [Thalassotalea insulae]|uniref:MSHA biogenesis protein MshC n=1 Tax=Thalassotalea insulae TaxID=2056778 RepID=A0ABQ6GPF1_9GAMM|nr:type II secretion system protein [Thalassotalea insulae]GLX77863.1 MSHA biogenesis protein MshC [Thalassotalea insulae]